MVDKTQAATSAYSTKVTNSAQQKSPEQLKAEHRKQGEYYVIGGEYLYTIAKNANMSLTDFKKKTGLIKDSLQAGQIIKNIPTKEIKAGQGLQAFCRENNVDYKLFLALNGINEKYIAQPGEKFFMPAVNNQQTPKADPNTEPKKLTPEPQKEEKNNKDEVKVTLNNGKTWTAKALRDDAIRSAKNAPEFKKADNVSYIDRPLPNIVNGKIEAACTVQLPTYNKGSMKNKLVILNAGHGGYQQENGFFDAGAVSTRADGEGKMVPLEEWKVAQKVIDSLSPKLRGEGSTVITVSGATQNGGMHSQKYLEGLIAGNKGPADVRNIMKNTKKSDIIFISIHFESAASDKMGCSVCAQKPKNGKVDNGDLKLAQNINSALKEGFTTMTPEIVERNLYVTRSMGDEIPAVLLEVGNLHNQKIHRSALSAHDINKYTDCLLKAIDVTYNPPKPKKK